MAPKKKSLKRRMESSDSDDEPVPPLYDSDGELHPEDAQRGLEPNLSVGGNLNLAGAGVPLQMLCLLRGRRRNLW